MVLHEHRSGYAGTHIAVWGLDQKCRQWGVQRVYGTTVTGYERDASGSVTAVETDQGSDIACEQVVVGAGSVDTASSGSGWAGRRTSTCKLSRRAHVEEQMDMWTYWRLLEGEVLLPEGVDFRTAQHRDSPVLHVELHEHTRVYGEDGTMIKDHTYVLHALRSRAGGRSRSPGRNDPHQDRPLGRRSSPTVISMTSTRPRILVRRLLLLRPGHAVQAPREPAALLQGPQERWDRRVHARQRAGVRPSSPTTRG